MSDIRGKLLYSQVLAGVGNEVKTSRDSEGNFVPSFTFGELDSATGTKGMKIPPNTVRISLPKGVSRRPNDQAHIKKEICLQYDKAWPKLALPTINFPRAFPGGIAQQQGQPSAPPVVAEATSAPAAPLATAEAVSEPAASTEEAVGPTRPASPEETTEAMQEPPSSADPPSALATESRAQVRPPSATLTVQRPPSPIKTGPSKSQVAHKPGGKPGLVQGRLSATPAPRPSQIIDLPPPPDPSSESESLTTGGSMKTKQGMELRNAKKKPTPAEKEE
ncbi:hypothetical protein [Sporisorium scitamineum]|uniref:Uncharacterized protein n=1 Tax=Sporisorium scitamineum TaxID=49012 RepID=A0A0F7S038_9BASI|nr:hypothetical protein [Sporisorium scitamineum]